MQASPFFTRFSGANFSFFGRKHLVAFFVLAVA
jgi:hypothetical protein